MVKCSGVAFALMLAACTEPELADNDVRVVDQADGEFFWSCTESACGIHRIAGVTPPIDCNGEAGHYSWGAARFVNVTPFCPHEDAWTQMDQPRLLICKTDSDCPTLAHHGHEWECRAGYCQSTDTDLRPPGMPRIVEFGHLCLRDSPRWTDYRRQWREFDSVLRSACPAAEEDNVLPCDEIPPGCDDPR